MKFFARFLATVAYVGHAPVAPGTAGSLAALPIIWFAYPRLTQATALYLVAAVCAVAIWAAHQQTKDGQKDPQFVVIDELAGQMIALLFLPLSILTMAGGFVSSMYSSHFPRGSRRNSPAVGASSWMMSSPGFMRIWCCGL
jgi:phosphatidylglycerophosphatase A